MGLFDYDDPRRAVRKEIEVISEVIKEAVLNQMHHDIEKIVETTVQRVYNEKVIQRQTHLAALLTEVIRVLTEDKIDATH